MTNPYQHTHDIDEVSITTTMALTISKFLHYSFEPVDYDYDSLTPQERALCTKEDFDQVVKWLRNE